MLPLITRGTSAIRHRKLPAGDLEALSQGELDGLCGLYAAINAVRLLFAVERPLTHREEKNLFDAGISHLHEQGILASAAVGGFDPKTWMKLMRALARYVAFTMGRNVDITVPLRKVRRPSLETMFDVIEVAVTANRIVLIELSGTYQHFTVVRGVGASRLTLFDSGVLCWLSRQNCAIKDIGNPTQHIINPHSMTIMGISDVPAANPDGFLII